MSKRIHDISGGIDITGGQLETAKMIFYSVLAWFSITLEAFLRRDFGERYYTKANFFVGFWTLNAFFFLMGIFSAFGSPSSSSASVRWGIWWGYLILSAFHFWKIWVNAQIGRPQHSVYDGTSHLQPLSRWVLRWLNPLLAMGARGLGSLTLSNRNFGLLCHSLQISPVLPDEEKFTKMWLEPFVLLLLWLFVPQIPSMWLLVGLTAHIVFTRMRYANLRNEELDITDGIIEAAFAKENKESQERIRLETREAVFALQARVQTDPTYMEEIQSDHPDIMQALDELDIDLGGSKTE